MTRERRIWLTATLVLALLLVSAVPALSAPGDTARVWVQYRPGQQVAVQRTLEQAGGQFHYTFPQLEAHVVTLPVVALRGVANNPNVVAVEDDVPRELLADAPAEAYTQALAALAANGQTRPYGIDSVQAPLVWPTTTGEGRTVCVVDTGLHRNHEDLKDADVPGGYSQVGTPWSTDGHGHGTHVAGTIAATDNTIGVVGVAPDVSLYIVKVFNDNGQWTLSSDLVDAIYRCRDGGANVISMSLGGSRSNSRERNAFDQLYAQGILHVAAAGNAGNSAYSYPASYNAVISVAAVNQSNVVASFSQKNNQVELAAPGVGVLSTVPYGTLYEAWSGTSMATPHVSAVAALVWSANPAWTNGQIREALQVSAFDLGPTGRDNSYGYGLVQAFAALDYLGGGEQPLPDNPPSVTITFPANGDIVSSTVTVTANASDDNGVDQVEFFVNGTSIGVDTNGSNGWSAVWDTTATANGSATVRATATDTIGQTASNEVSVTVSNESTPEPPPEGIVLTGTATKVKGFNAAQLSWSGASGAVNVFRDGSTVPLATVPAGTTTYTDSIGTRGPATHAYQVCEVGDSSNCSNVLTLSF